MTTSGQIQLAPMAGESLSGKLASGGPAERYSVDLDIGGTFTDAIFSRKGFAKLIKVETTPHDLSVCFQKALEKGAEELGFENLSFFLSRVRVIRLSTSLSINVLLERKGVWMGLLLEKGWRDEFLGLRDFPQGTGPPVAQHMVLEVGTKPNGAEIREAACQLIREGADVLVISLNDPEGFLQAEQLARGIIHQFYANHFIGSVPVVTSGQLSQSVDYMGRSSRIVYNTYSHGVLAEPFLDIEDRLRKLGYALPLLLVHANGGASRVSKTTAEQTVNSGASAGIFGAQRFSRFYGLKNVVTVDIGGTSTEIGIVKNGRIAPTQGDRHIANHMPGGSPIAFSVGIGGGSVVRVDENRAIALGPQSMGAFPGPACYDLGGGEPTLTDVFLLLGYFDEGYFLGGERRLNRRSAETVFTERIANPLGLSCEAAAWFVKREAVKCIAREMECLLSRHGLRPEETALFAVGGCGGCMGCDLCDAAGFSELYVFRQGSVFGAYGSSGMDVTHRYKQRLTAPLGVSGRQPTEVCDTINATVLTLQRKAFQDMAAEGFQPDTVYFELSVEVESRETGIRCNYDCPSVFLWPGEWRAFRKGIMRQFETNVPGIQGLELYFAGIALTATARIPHAGEDALASPMAAERLGDRRSTYAGDGRWIGAPVHNWDAIQVPFFTTDACVLESHDTTLVVPTGFEMRIDKRRNAVIRKSAKG
jgi:N-methylhydantoinase A/oxoprolinase/acetone carboxylase beta subunit